jgi:hypothetical protein
MKIQLIAGWSSSWKWISMQTAAIITVLNTFALSFPPSWSPEVHIVTVVLGAVTMYGRIIQQVPTEKKDE